MSQRAPETLAPSPMAARWRPREMHDIAELRSPSPLATSRSDPLPVAQNDAPAWVDPGPRSPAPEPRSQADRQLHRLTLAAGTLAVLATLFAVREARDFLLPVVLALLLTGVLRPVVHALARHGWPTPLAAAASIAASVVAVALATYQLVGPAVAWIARVPAAMARLEPKLRWIQAIVSSATELADRLTSVARPSGAAERVELQADSMVGALLGTGRHVVVGAIVVAVLVYFALAAGEALVDRWLDVLPVTVDRRRARACVGAVERQISTYLSTVTSINFCLGAAVSFTLWLVGLPNPVLWGVLVAALNFVPYLGSPVAIGTIAVASFLTFDDPLRMVSGPLACVGLSIIEAYFVTPVVVGRSLSVSPAAVFLSLAFWSWAWGLPGAIIAVPMLMALKIVLDSVPALAPWGRLLAGGRAAAPTCEPKASGEPRTA